MAWIQQLRLDALWQTAIVVLASLLCITFHETCHGLVAYWLGDSTAKRAGRLSLNPLRHIDWMGLLMMAICRFGWAKPVPVDMRNFKNPKLGMAWTALAGPVSNVLLAFLAMLCYSVCSYLEIVKQAALAQYLSIFFSDVVVISAGLAVFNLFPIPPLDGSKIMFAILPDRWYARLMQYERYGMFLLAVLLLTDVLDTPLQFLRNGLISALSEIGTFPFYLLLKFSV